MEGNATNPPTQGTDLAPDANEPGDTVLPIELHGDVHEGEIVPDNVDKAEVAE